VPQVALHHAFIKASQPGSTACHPSQEIADHVEAAPNAVVSEPNLYEMRRVKLEELSVGAVLEAPEQPAPVQVLFCNHHLVLRC